MWVLYCLADGSSEEFVVGHGTKHVCVNDNEEYEGRP